MSIVLKVKTQPNKVLLSRLFESYINSAPSVEPSDEVIVAAAKEFYAKMKNGERKEFASANLALHPSMFEVTGDEEGHVTPSDVYFGLNAFAKEVYSLVSGDETKPVNFEGVERKKLPDLSAFDLVGNNAPKESMRLANYALVYGS